MSLASSSCTSSPPSTDSSPVISAPPNLRQNSTDPSARWLVQKFGGTSIGKFAVKIAQDVVANHIDQYKIAIVCSARSGSTKSLGTTSLLLRSATQTLQSRRKNGNGFKSYPPLGLFSRSNSQDSEDASRPETPRSHSDPSSSNSPTSPCTVQSSLPDFCATVDIIQKEHLKAACSSIRDSVILQDVVHEIEHDCDWLRSFLFAAQVIDEISPRTQDSIVGLGERLSSKIMTAVLRDQGIDAEYISLEDIVPQVKESDDPSREIFLGQEFYDELAFVLGKRVRQCGSRVPVITGFFGAVPGSLLTQIGRGYTDLCAALVAVGIEASELQIWKEVDGIFTADPRKVPTARLIPVISPEEAAELTYYGSEVVHPFTMEQAIRRKIPVRIKNVENPEGNGTVIHPQPEVEPASNGSVVLNDTTQRSFVGDKKRQGLPTAVTTKEHIVVLNVNSNRKSVSHGFLAGIFSTLDRYGIVVDLISTSEVHVSMAIENGITKKILERLIKELERIGMVSVHNDMSILSLVGKEMRNSVGIAGKMFTTLAQGNVNIEMISQGASEINISCVIGTRDAVKALNLIHQSCLQIMPDGLGKLGPWLF